MLFQIAWRNIFRAKGKTTVTILLLVLSTVILTTFIALIVGTFNKMYENAVDIYPGSIHVNQKIYPDSPTYDNLIFNTQHFTSVLKKHDLIQEITTRVESFFLFSSQENSVGAMLVGVEPSKEQKSVRLSKSIIKGRYLNDNDTNGVVIGASLAKKLDVDLGGTISIIGSSTDRSFAAANLEVVGIYKTAIDKMDSGLTHINRSYLDELIMSQNSSSYIIITPKDKDASQELALTLNSTLGTQEIEIVDWHTHMAKMIEGLELIRISRYMMVYFFITIIFAVIAIFAFLMIFARKREVGVMRALGTTPKQVDSILALERMLLTLISIIIGLVISGGISYWLEVSPIVMSNLGEMVQRIGIMEFVLKTKFSFAILAQGGITIFVLSLTTIIYPIWYISRMKPIDAIHST